jgi:hypothetical protein
MKGNCRMIIDLATIAQQGELDAARVLIASSGRGSALRKSHCGCERCEKASTIKSHDRNYTLREPVPRFFGNRGLPLPVWAKVKRLAMGAPW